MTLSQSEAEDMGQLLTLIADPIRLRVLCSLATVDELCVGDIALALDISMDQSSYALRQLKAARFVQVRRDGRIMNYRLADTFPKPLLEHCLRQLLQLSEETA